MMPASLMRLQFTSSRNSSGAQCEITSSAASSTPVLLPSFRVMQITRRGGVLRPLRSSQHGGQVGIEQISPLGTGARLWPFGL